MPCSSLGEIAYSPCPNDTFAFHAWAHGLIDAPAIQPVLLDIEALNHAALQGKYAVSKMSAACYGTVREEYELLAVGAAFSRGGGPIAVAARPGPWTTLAVPGLHTTAAALARWAYPNAQLIPMRYDEIIPYLLEGRCDAGVLIHESGMTFARWGLIHLADLGHLYAERERHPVPLGVVAAKRSLGAAAITAVTTALQQSIRHARANPSASWEYLLAHAQEKDPVIVQRHIDAYVSADTESLTSEGRAALEHFLRLH